MDENRRRDQRRKDIVWTGVIIFGIILGLFIKRVSVGLLIGLALGLLAVGVGRKK